MTDGHVHPVSVSGSPRARLNPDDARDLLALAFEHSPLGMVLFAVASPGAHPRWVIINHAFAQMIGYSVDELLASPDQHGYTHRDDRASDLVHLQLLWEGRNTVTHWDKRYLHAAGHVVWARVSVSVLRGPDRQPRYFIGQVQDITELREREAQLLERAERDPLTGLLNRSAFDAHAHEQMVRCDRYGERAELLLIDLDGLKQINDNRGHVVGDKALVAVADVLRNRLRDGDVAARLGGDEFVVLLPHTDHDEARRIAADVMSTVALTTVGPHGDEVALSVSVGSTEVTSGAGGIEPTLVMADQDMYAVKRRRDAAR